MLYQLTIIDLELSDNMHREAFSIGLFESREEAERIACFYLTHVRGFCDYPCVYEINEKECSGQKVEENSEVFMAVGWNTDENLDEVDIIESPCFISRIQANTILERMKEQYDRSEWTVQCRKVGQAGWSEGFVRTLY